MFYVGVIIGAVLGWSLTMWWFYDGIQISLLFKKGKRVFLFDKGNPNQEEAFRLLNEGAQKMRYIRPRLEVLKDD